MRLSLNILLHQYPLPHGHLLFEKYPILNANLKNSSSNISNVSPSMGTPIDSNSPLRPTPLGSPVRGDMNQPRTYLEDMVHITKLNPQDTWIPLTESRKGNTYYSAFNNLNADIGFQAFLLRVDFTYLGW